MTTRVDTKTQGTRLRQFLLVKPTSLIRKGTEQAYNARTGVKSIHYYSHCKHLKGTTAQLADGAPSLVRVDKSSHSKETFYCCLAARA